MHNNIVRPVVGFEGLGIGQGMALTQGCKVDQFVAFLTRHLEFLVLVRWVIFPSGSHISSLVSHFSEALRKMANLSD